MTARHGLFRLTGAFPEALWEEAGKSDAKAELAVLGTVRDARLNGFAAPGEGDLRVEEAALPEIIADL
jgi:hypothetical protein